MAVKPGSPEALTAEISQGRWLVIADTLEPPGQQKQASGLRWLSFLVAVAENRQGIALWTAIGTILALTFSFLIPNHYTASTQLLPPQLNQSAVSAMLGQVGELASLAGRDAIRNPSALFVVLLRSRNVVERVITRLDLMKVYSAKRLSDCRARLEKQTQIEAMKEGVIVLQVDDRDPQRAAIIANAYVEELIALNKRLAVGEASRRRIFFEQQMRETREQLTNAEEALQHAQENTGVIQPDSQAKSVIEFAVLLQANIALKKARLEKIRTFATEQNPDLVRVQSELHALQTELEHMEKRDNKNGVLDFSAARMPASGLEYMRRVREVKYDEAISEMLTKQLELARIDEAKEGSLIQVIDPAEVPDRKSGPSRSLMTVLGFVLSLVFSLGWVAMRNVLQHARLNPETGAQLALLKGTLKFSLGKNGNV
jgi:uncharacterized protein involved in exopolysaccharide biosynthesis